MGGKSEERCIVCGAPARARAHAGASFSECSACGYALLANGSRRDDYWGDEAASHPDEEYWREAREAYFDSALDLLATLTRGRRLLDFGGGIGFFAERALARGWDAFSFDVSEKVADVAASRLGRERAWTRLPEDAKRTFDAVTLWCVVAHTRSPETVVRAAADALAPGGRIWITTPNFAFEKQYAVARAILRRPLDFAADDHVGHFTPNAIRRLLEREGFRDVAFHFRGITETCVAASSNRRVLLEGKRLWNHVTFGAARVGLPNGMSELQVTAQRA